MNEIRDLNTLFDVLNQGTASVEFVKKLAELEKTERLISEGRLVVYCQKLKKDSLAELLIDEGIADRVLFAIKSNAQIKLVAAV